MTPRVLLNLYAHYPQVIQEMDTEFTSHRFILKLAQRYQTEYIEALYHYRENPTSEHPTPFKIVHGFIAKHLLAHPDLVTHIGEVDSSEDIFTNENRCANWQRV